VEACDVRLKAPLSFAREVGLRACRCVVYVGGYSYEGRPSVDDNCIRIGLPAEIGSPVLNGSDRAEFWANVRVADGFVEVYECRDPQRTLLEFVLGVKPFAFAEAIGSLSPNYAKGQRHCSVCRRAFYTTLVKCPYCGRFLRPSPRRPSRREEKKYVDPERYGVRG